jgi:hypothetical protein
METANIQKILIGGLAFIGGALVGGLVQTTEKSYERFKEAKGLAIAIRAEISSLRAVIQARQYVSILDQLIGRLGDPSHVVVPEDVFAISVRQDYMEVFRACLPKIGLLGGLSGSVVLLYSIVKALLDDIAQLVEVRHLLVEKKALPMAAGTERANLLAAMQATRTWMVSGLERAPAVEAELQKFTQKRFWFLFL